MSFAQGFAAGSAAAQRGIDMGLAMKKREEEEQYKAQMAGLAKEYQQSQDAVTAYEQQRAGLEATGAPMASAVAQPQYSPEAQQIFGIGGPAPQMSMSPVSAPTAGLVAGDRAGVVMPEAPQAMSYADMQRRAAGIALGAGRTGEYLQLQGALDAREQADRQYQFTVEKFDEMNRQFNARMEEQIRATKASEADADERIELARQENERLQEQAAANIKDLTTRLDAFVKDRNTVEATNVGRQIFKSGQINGKSVADSLIEIEEAFPGEENALRRLAATTAATDEYFQQNGINGEIAKGLAAKAAQPINQALNTDFGGDIAEEAKNWNVVLQGFADPDYSDGIETKLVQVKDPDTGEPTGAFTLEYGDRTLEQFGSIQEVRNYAKEYRDNFASPMQIGKYLEDSKTKAAADIARAKSAGEKEKLFAGFLKANPHLMGDDKKLMQLRLTLGMPSPLGGWGSGSDEYINPGDATATKDDQTFSSVTAGLVKRREENRAKLAPSMFRGPTAEETAKGQDLVAEVITAIESGSLSPAEAERAIYSVDASPQARRMALDEIARYRTGLK